MPVFSANADGLAGLISVPSQITFMMDGNVCNRTRKIKQRNIVDGPMFSSAFIVNICSVVPPLPLALS